MQTFPLPKEAMIMFTESTRTGKYSFLQTLPLPKEAIVMFIESRTGVLKCADLTIAYVH